MSLVKNVVIAAAGMGKRLGLGMPKCLVKVAGKTILEYQLDLLKKFDNVFIVVGFGEGEVIKFAKMLRKDIIFVRNTDFFHTKTLESFYLAAKIIDGFAFFLDGDMIIEPESFDKFVQNAISHQEMTVAVSQRIFENPVYCDMIENNGKMMVKNFSYENKSDYEWANIAFMSANLINGGDMHMFEYLKNYLPMRAEIIDRFEIDTMGDLQKAEVGVNSFFQK